MSHLVDMYRYEWSLIFIHLIMIGQLVLAILYYKKHPSVSICMFIFLALSFLFIITPYSISYDNPFGRFMFHVFHIINTGILTLAIFGWREWPETEDAKDSQMTRQEGTPAVSLPVNPMIRIEPGFYWGFVGLWIVNVIINIVSMIAIASEESEIVVGAGVFALLVLIPMGIFGGIMLYRAWSIIQDGHARTTPGKAVGFCFIPFFNFYWIFVAFGGLAKDINAFAKRYNLKSVELSEELFSIQCVLIILNVVISRIPIVGHIFGIAIGVLGLYLFRQIVVAVNAINQQAVMTPSAPEQSAPAVQS